MKQTARLAGALYLIVVLSGLFSLMYVPQQLRVPGDPAGSVQAMIDHEMLFRSGVYAGIIGYIAFLVLPLVLYKLLSPVNKTYAVSMVAFAVVSVPISLVNMLNKFAILTLISRPDFLKGMSADQFQAQILFYKDLYGNGNMLASIFWGLWLFPFGYLVYKSGFLPKVLGVLLMFGCFGYLFSFTGNFFLPNYDELGLSFITIPGSLGEIGICLWLLIVGVKSKQPASLQI